MIRIKYVYKTEKKICYRFLKFCRFWSEPLWLMSSFFNPYKNPCDRTDDECNELRSQNPISIPVDRMT